MESCLRPAASELKSLFVEKRAECLSKRLTLPSGKTPEIPPFSRTCSLDPLVFHKYNADSVPRPPRGGVRASGPFAKVKSMSTQGCDNVTKSWPRIGYLRG